MDIKSIVIFLSIVFSGISEKIDGIPKDGLSTRRFEKLYGKARSINFFKTKISKSYQKWDKEATETIKILKEVENSLKSYSKATNIGQIVGEVSTILGTFASLCGIFILKDEMMAETFKRIGRGFTIAGTVTVKGSTILSKVLAKKGCNSGKRPMDALMTLTQELEDGRKEYFRLVKEFEAILDGLNENELKILQNYLEENQLGNVMNDVDLDPSVINNIPPIIREMDRLKIREDILNIEIFEFNLIPKISEEIKNDPIMKEILSMRSEYVPFANGENAFLSLQAVSSLKSMMNVVDLIPIDNKIHKFNNSPFIDGVSNIFLLVEKIINLTVLMSSGNEVSAQCEEIGRVANELKQYTSDMRDILSDTLKWEYGEDNLISIDDANYIKIG
ncbi:uncharacterized protein LOC111618141 [Centruroides sculpturatus]|uniref:uncharacterized protein LOC111618141 n=1 Tax=Centruroides sculpturatus TaxID=218467 RepID=UPI000C6E3088|nr:uncharacterized protein LOC111618141 [Centruroides sculpturatus]XP_023215363.1 uncharacterized protein LOC111618141 [Centruroides sculpturatus]